LLSQAQNDFLGKGFGAVLVPGTNSQWRSVSYGITVPDTNYFPAALTTRCTGGWGVAIYPSSSLYPNREVGDWDMVVRFGDTRYRYDLSEAEAIAMWQPLRGMKGVTTPYWVVYGCRLAGETDYRLLLPQQTPPLNGQGELRRHADILPAMAAVQAVEPVVEFESR
jgi:hypothetical protein